jgi:hypothetical protein
MIKDAELVKEKMHTVVHAMTELRVALAECETKFEKFYPIVTTNLEEAERLIKKIHKLEGKDDTKET